MVGARAVRRSCYGASFVGWEMMLTIVNAFDLPVVQRFCYEESYGY